MYIMWKLSQQNHLWSQNIYYDDDGCGAGAGTVRTTLYDTRPNLSQHSVPVRNSSYVRIFQFYVVYVYVCTYISVQYDTGLQIGSWRFYDVIQYN